MKKALFTFCLILNLTWLYGQYKLPAKNVELTNKFHERLDFNAAYYGNMAWNPGLKFGAEYVWKEKQKVIKYPTRDESVVTQKILSADLGFYWDPKNHVGLFNGFGIIFRKTNTINNRQLNFKINPIGYYRSFLPETYEVKGNQVEKIFLPGRNHFAPSVSIGFGKLQKGKKLKARFINFNIMFIMPYNTNFLPLLSMDYGYRFNIRKKNNSSIAKEI